jgi:hypothetical protein
MNRTLFALLVLVAVSLCACSDTQTGTATATTSPSAAPSATAVAINTAEMEKRIIELEKKSWELFRAKNAEENAKLIAPGYQSVYFGAIKSEAESHEDGKHIEIKKLDFSDWKVTFPTKDVAILTYKGTSTSTYKGKDTSGTYVMSSVWVNINGEWKSALYHETRAEK